MRLSKYDKRLAMGTSKQRVYKEFNVLFFPFFYHVRKIQNKMSERKSSLDWAKKGQSSLVG